MNQTTHEPTSVRTKYIRATEGTTLVLKYRHQDAQGIRAAVQRIRLNGDRQPSLALIARRSMALYLDRLASSPAVFVEEVKALDRLATPPASRIRKCACEKQ